MSDSTLKLCWLDDIESQIDENVPHYVPRLIAEIRRLTPSCCGEDHIVGSCPDDCFACLAEQRDELLANIRLAADSFCSLNCPSVFKSQDEPRHIPDCERIRASIASVEFPMRRVSVSIKEG